MISENENDILMMGRCNQGLADKLEAARAERDELKERISGLITFGEKRDAEALRLAELLDHSLKKGQELRAELQAPAGSDVETAAKLWKEIKTTALTDTRATARIAAALHAAREDCEAVKVAAREAVDKFAEIRRDNYIAHCEGGGLYSDADKEILPTENKLRDALAAALEGE